MSKAKVYVRPVTEKLFQAILLDCWPDGFAVCVDFGMDRKNRQQVYESYYYYPIRAGEITAEQLDAALGNGPALTQLVRSCPSNPHKSIEIKTAWDYI